MRLHSEAFTTAWESLIASASRLNSRPASSLALKAARTVFYCLWQCSMSSFFRAASRLSRQSRACPHSASIPKASSSGSSQSSRSAGGSSSSSCSGSKPQPSAARSGPQARRPCESRHAYACDVAVCCFEPDKSPCIFNSYMPFHHRRPASSRSAMNAAGIPAALSHVLAMQSRFTFSCLGESSEQSQQAIQLQGQLDYMCLACCHGPYVVVTHAFCRIGLGGGGGREGGGGGGEAALLSH